MMIGAKTPLSAGANQRTGVTSCADAFRTMRRPRPHHVPTRSASCADRIRIMHGRTPHNTPVRFVPRKAANRAK
ncbi:MAG: hypothetical protein K2I86_04825 [Prevotella sp.]|nr:hypothetical protein [Prevotella sp.]